MIGLVGGSGTRLTDVCIPAAIGLACVALRAFARVFSSDDGVRETERSGATREEERDDDIRRPIGELAHGVTLAMREPAELGGHDRRSRNTGGVGNIGA